MKKSFTWQLGAILMISLLLSSCKKETVCDCTKDSDVATVKVFATGLNNPRGLKFGPDGNLYVAEGGTGGTESTAGQCEQVPPPLGPFLGSETGGRISKIGRDGQRTTVTDQLPSTQSTEATGSNVQGVADVAFVGNTLYGLLAAGGCAHGVPDIPNGVVKVNPDGSWDLVADISAYVRANPVANPEPADFDPDETPYSMIRVGDDFYAVFPNHGELVKITTDGNITRVVDISASQGHIVPTVIAYHGGNFYVGNLNVFPIVEGSSSIYKISPEGAINEWATGFTTVLGVAFDKEGRLYVLENTTGAQFPTPNTGRIVRIDSAGNKEVVVSGLNLPTGMTFGPDGKLYVSTTGFGPAAIGGGQVVQVTLKDCKCEEFYTIAGL